MNPIRPGLTAAVVVALFAVSAAAQEPAAVEAVPAAATGVKEPSAADLLKRVEELEQAAAKSKADAESKPVVGFTGQFQADSLWFAQTAESRRANGDIQDGAGFRRARFGFQGDYGVTEYRIEADFALAGRPTILDMYAGFKDLPYVGRVWVGRYFEPFSLERYTRNRFITFLERSLIDQPFAPARTLGILAQNTYADKRGTWQLGAFHTFTDAFGDDVSDGAGYAGTGRVTYLPWMNDEGDRFLHVGAAYSYRATRDGVARFRTQGEARFGASTPNVPFLLDTGDVPARYFQLAGFEAAWVHGPFSMQGEYVLAPVGTVAGGDPVLTGWYAFASLFLTGEHRPYNRDFGTFTRVMPRRDFVKRAEGGVEFGPGAVEVAVRLSGLDLDSGPIHGGRQTDAAFGLNWYLNPYTRFTFNYIRVFQRPAKGGYAQTDEFGARFGFDF